jgi:hypothetical protein
MTRTGRDNLVFLVESTSAFTTNRCTGGNGRQSGRTMERISVGWLLKNAMYGKLTLILTGLQRGGEEHKWNRNK